MKDKRQEKILEIIKNNVILTQDDLQNALRKLGFNITQSTVSRDIKELRLIKGHDSSGNYRYVNGDVNSDEQQPTSHYREIFSRYTISVEYSLNDVVIKCYNGMASSVCVAVDAMFKGMMLGTIAGEDTIFIVTHGTDEAEKLTLELKKMM